MLGGTRLGLAIVKYIAAAHGGNASVVSEVAKGATFTVLLPLAGAPDGDLAAEVFFLRALAGKQLPAPRLIAYDLACTLVPFTYALEGYTGGAPLDRLPDGPLMRVAARQVGRTLRRAHQIAAPGFGRPTTAGRWPTRSWGEALDGWLARRETMPRAAEVLGSAGLDALRAATRDHAAGGRGRRYTEKLLVIASVLERTTN